MISEAKTEKTTTTTAIAPIAADEADKIFAFSEILRKMEETDEKAVIPLLEKIESNTSILKKIKLSGSDARAITAKGSITRTAPLSRGEKATPKGKANGLEVEKGPVTARRVSREEATAPAGTAIPEKKVDAKPMEPKETARDKGGRFVGKSKSQEARAEQGDKSERKSILQSLKNGFEGISGKGKSTLASNAGTLEEAAGRAAGGPMFEAAMEIKGAIDSARDEDGMIGKAARKLGEKVGFSKKEDQTPKEGRDDKGRFLTAKGDEAAKIIETLKSTENEDEKRHEELIKAILKGDKGKTGESMGLPSLRKTGPGSTAKEKRRKAMKKGQSPVAQRMPKMPGGGGLGGGGILSTLLSRFALPVMAVAGAGLAGAAIGTAINGLIDLVTEKVSDGKHKTAGEAVYDVTHKTTPPKSVVEGYKEQRGNIAAASAATGMSEDTLTKMAGVESSFDSKAGATTSSAKGTYQFTGRTWREMLAKHGGKYGLSQNTSVYDPRANALMGAEYTKENKQALEAAGIKADDTSLYMSHFLGTGGGVKFMKNLQGGKGDQIAANDFRKEAASNQNIFFDKKSGRARSYKEIHSMLSARMNQFGKDRMEALAAGKGETAIASADQRLAELKAEKDTTWDKKTEDQKYEWAQRRSAVIVEKERQQAQAKPKPVPAVTTATAIKTAPEKKTPVKAMARKTETTAPIVEASGRPVLSEGEITTKEAQTAKVASAAAGQSIESVEPVATATPVADIRKRVFRKTRARLAARGGAKSLEAKPVEGGAMSSPVAPMAEAVAVQGPSKVQQPERIQPSVDEQPRAAKVASAAAGASGEGAASAPGMDKLIAMMTKMMSGKEAGGGVQQIRTEFDDTMLTLMAYDRV